MSAALRMLSRRDLSEEEVRERLGRKGFSPAEGSAAIRRLVELGLVDDQSFCARLVRSYRETRGYGSAKIAWALRARGFPLELVERALRESGSEEEELAAARAALRRKFRGGIPPGRQGAARAYRFLAGRGFSPGTCRKAIGNLSSDILEGEG
jgi:regulatory protein